MKNVLVNGSRETRRVTMHWRTCSTCGAWLPLSASDESPVAAEVRAAEIAEHEASNAPVGCMDSYESAGFTLRAFNGPGVSEAWAAGYLARCILDHDGDQMSAASSDVAALTDADFARMGLPTPRDKQ